MAESARVVEPEKPAEPARQERVEAQDSAKLPSDPEVLAEVRRIVAAEGICTPRRLARALCPVDRTPTGELRSRIANRIQALTESGKLQRERLVVGGTSVETILVRDERNGKTTVSAPAEAAAAPETPTEQEVSQEKAPETPVASEPAYAPVAQESAPEPNAAPEAATAPSSLLPMISSRELETAGLFEIIQRRDDPAPEFFSETHGPEAVDLEGDDLPVTALDALVESVLRSQDVAAALLHKEKPEVPLQLPEPTPEPAPAPAEPPKRSRSRRKAPAKAAQPEPNGANAQ